jgi:Xaa-Pro aminopeptidase
LFPIYPEEVRIVRDVPFAEIPFDEYTQRKGKAIDLMATYGFDGLLLFNPMNIHYYSGFRKTWTLQWMHCCVFSREGQMSLIVPQIMDEFCRESTWLEDEWIRPFGGADHWGLPQDPVATVVETITDMGMSEKTIGVETGVPHMYMLVALSEFNAIRNTFPKATCKNAVEMIWAQRMIKSPWEQDIMRRLVHLTIKGYKKAIEEAHEGMTEEEILNICWRVFLDEGACDTPMAGDLMLRGGAKNYAMSTPRQVNRPLTKGRQMFFDGGASLKGYYCDFQRQLCVGEPPALQRRLVEVSEAGQQAAEEKIKPGNRICDAHAAAMSVIDKIPEDLKAQGVENLYSHTFMGHGEGLNIHEPPWITADNETVIKPGMVLALEIPALDIPQFRVLGGFPEDIYLVTEDGHERLTAGMERKEHIVL